MSATQTDPTVTPAVGTVPPAATAPGAPPPASNTLLATDPSRAAEPATRPAAPQTWPDDWREKVIGSDDAKEMKRLERYGSPQDVWRAYRAMEQKFSSGEYKRSDPGDNATAEEVTAWRKENGIPEAAEGYLEKLPEGLKIDKEDGPLLKAYLAEMHKVGAPPKYVHAAIKSYYDVQKAVDQELGETDINTQRASEDVLRSEWGNEYRANLNAIHGVLAVHLGAGLAALIDARLQNGTKVGNDATLIKGLLALAKEVNPAATIVPASAGTGGQGIEQRLTELTKMMGDQKSDYWKRGAIGEKIQAEYRQLIDAQDRMKQRAA